MKVRLFRWSLAVCLGLASIWLFRKAVSGHLLGGMIGLLMMFGCVIVAILLVLPELLPIVTRPFTALIDAVYGTGPGGRGKPPLNYHLARAYVEQDRMEDALTEYERISQYYPREVEPYREGILILLRHFDDRDEAEELYRRGRSKVRGREDREALRRALEDAVEAEDAETGS